MYNTYHLVQLGNRFYLGSGGKKYHIKKFQYWDKNDIDIIKKFYQNLQNEAAINHILKMCSLSEYNQFDYQMAMKLLESLWDNGYLSGEIK